MNRPKLTAPLAGLPILHWSVTHASTACSRVIVVLGHQAQIIRDAIPDLENVDVVVNDRYQSGMLSSIQRGAEEVTAPWFFIAPADMPFLRPDLYRRISAVVFENTVPDSAVAAHSCMAYFPAKGGVTGHPVLVRGDILPDLKQAGTEFRSMRHFLRQYETCSVEVDDEAIHIDIDTDQRYRELAMRAGELL